MENILKTFLDNLKTLRRDIKAEHVEQIAKKSLRIRSENLGSYWFNEILSTLSNNYGFSAQLLEKYSTGCAKLIKLSSPNNLKKSYLDSLNTLIRTFRDDLIIPIQQGMESSQESAFESFFKTISSPEENEYLNEAIMCAKNRFYRAAVVLGWCAAIDRIHRKIEALGFSKFNITSAQMASQTKGRFKRFNQPQNVRSMSELREVFDTIVIWIIEGMGLIDSNQHTRLRSCFDMRCHGAHPGDAPITQYNLLSFFSDIDQIVLNSPTFQVNAGKVT
jgi:hypothetical protein